MPGLLIYQKKKKERNVSKPKIFTYILVISLAYSLPQARIYNGVNAIAFLEREFLKVFLTSGLIKMS